MSLLLLCGLAVDSHAFAQGATNSPAPVTGVVKDAQGMPVVGVAVIENGTTNGVTTDVDGRFSISVSGDAVLEIRALGYKW